MTAAIDNDILIKGSCYGLINELVSNLCATCKPSVLGASRFVVPKSIAKRRLKGDVKAAIAKFEDFVKAANILEPSETEQKMAADFELAAQRAGVGLDVGESILSAITVARTLPALLTGDKRAIQALERLLTDEERLKPLCGKVHCLEQLIMHMTVPGAEDKLKATICAEPDMDKTLSICFSCSGPQVDIDSFKAGLGSYIHDLRTVAGRILAS